MEKAICEHCGKPCGLKVPGEPQPKYAHWECAVRFVHGEGEKAEHIILAGKGF